MLFQDQLEVQARAHKETEERLTVLIRMMDEQIRRNPPQQEPPPGTNGSKRRAEGFGIHPTRAVNHPLH